MTSFVNQCTCKCHAISNIYPSHLVTWTEINTGSGYDSRKFYFRFDLKGTILNLETTFPAANLCAVSVSLTLPVFNYEVCTKQTSTLHCIQLNVKRQAANHKSRGEGIRNGDERHCRGKPSPSSPKTIFH